MPLRKLFPVPPQQRQAQIIAKMTVLLTQQGIKLPRLETTAVLAAIHVGEAGNYPLTETAIARAMNTPRSSVQRHLHTLIEAGVVQRVGNVYVANPDYFRAPGADVVERFRLMREAIIEAGHELEALFSEADQKEARHAPPSNRHRRRATRRDAPRHRHHANRDRND